MTKLPKTKMKKSSRKSKPVDRSPRLRKVKTSKVASRVGDSDKGWLDLLFQNDSFNGCW